MHFGHVVVEGTRGEVVAHPRTGRSIFFASARWGSFHDIEAFLYGYSPCFTGCRSASRGPGSSDCFGRNGACKSTSMIVNLVLLSHPVTASSQVSRPGGAGRAPEAIAARACRCAAGRRIFRPHRAREPPRVAGRRSPGRGRDALDARAFLLRCLFLPRASVSAGTGAGSLSEGGEQQILAIAAR